MFGCADNLSTRQNSYSTRTDCLRRLQNAPATTQHVSTRAVGCGTHALRCKTVCCAKKQQDDSIQAPIPTKTQSSYFPQIVSNLLWNSASARERGKASCNVCKTAGVHPREKLKLFLSLTIQKICVLKDCKKRMSCVQGLWCAHTVVEQEC